MHLGPGMRQRHRLGLGLGPGSGKTVLSRPWGRASPTIRLVSRIRKKNPHISGQKTTGPQTVGYSLSESSTEIVRLSVALAATSMTRSTIQGRQPSKHDEREHQGTIDRFRANDPD